MPALRVGPAVLVSYATALALACSPPTPPPSDAGLDAAVSPDAPDGATPAPADPVASYMAARDAIATDSCWCSYPARDFWLVDDCIAFLAPRPAEAPCMRAALTSVPDAEPYVACLARAWASMVACVSAVPELCDYPSLSACEATRLEDEVTCRLDADLTRGAYESVLESCVETELVGRPRGCLASGARSMVTGRSAWTGTTVGAGDDYASGCGGVGAPDRALMWQAPSAGRWRFSTAGSQFDSILTLYSAACGAVALACDDDVDARAARVHAELELDLAELEDVAIVVDGAAGPRAAGEFYVHIERVR